MLVTEFLWCNERFRGDKVAFIDGDRRPTFSQLGERVRRFANALRGLGIGPGEHVATLASNSVQHTEIIFAIASIGAVWVPLNTRLSVPELTFIIEDSKSVAIVYSDDLLPTVEQLDTKIGDVRLWITIADSGRGQSYEDLIGSGSAATVDLAVDDNDLFTLMYTSGTTGRPKGVMLPHKCFALGTVLSALSLKAAETDIKLQCVPQFHAGGQIYQMTYVAAGSTVVILPHWDEQAVFDLIEGEGVTIGSFVPSMLMMLLESPRMRKTDFSRFARVVYGAAPIAADRLSLAMEITGAGFQQTYGQTESGVLVSILGEADHRRGLFEDETILRSCGRSMMGYALKVVDDGGRQVDDGEVGELIVNSDSLMTGYWGRPEATKKTLVNGWLQTGDLAWQDGEGRFYLVGRKTEMVISGGENVYPVEVENVISAHPDVLDVAIIGVPDDRWGEAVKAVVVPREGHAPRAEDIIGFCRDKLAGFKIPKSIDFIDVMPRNASGKITKGPLREPYWKGHGRAL